MSVPDHRHIVAQVLERGGHTLSTREGAGRFTEAVAAALHAADRNWGHLRKPPERTHVVGPDGNRHAVDVVLYRTSGQIVDIIAGAGDPGARITWDPGPEREYAESDWYAPDGAIGAPFPPPSRVQPYWGDERSRDIARVLFRDFARAGVPPNDGMGVWMGRMAYDVFERQENFDSALARHRQEWCAILSIPVE